MLLGKQPLGIITQGFVCAAAGMILMLRKRQGAFGKSAGAVGIEMAQTTKVSLVIKHRLQCQASKLFFSLHTQLALIWRC